MSEQPPRPVLVTGAAGFVGSHLVRALRAHGRPVRALVRDARRAEGLEGAEVVEGDVTRPETLRDAFAGVDAVVHLVAILQGRPEDFDRVIAGGTRHAVDAARGAGVRRFVYVSALGLNEHSRATIPYFRGKADAEEAVAASGLEHVILRPSFVTSPDGGAFPLFVRLARLTPVTPIVGSGTQRIQPIWIDDETEIIVRALDEPAAADRTIDVAGPDAVDWNELWRRLKRALGIRRPSVHVPMALMRAQAPLLERLPKPPVTRNELLMLEGGDNTGDVRPLVETFGVPLTPLDEQLRRVAAGSRRSRS
ncbi:MAG TPA: NAD(P)H-binding protein [Gaiellaceae bacterium]|nr:NAD(P)H-binding protein [Gaiellaceae bacterium]